MKREIIQFVSKTCSSCLIQKNVLNIIKEKYPLLVIKNIDIFANYDQALKYGVKGAPTLVFIEDDRAIKTHYGFQKEQQVLDYLELFGWIEDFKSI